MIANDRRLRSSLLCLGALAAAVQAQSDCVPSPLAMPVRNVTLEYGISRGVAMTVGNPGQTLSFNPSW